MEYLFAVVLGLFGLHEDCTKNDTGECVAPLINLDSGENLEGDLDRDALSNLVDDRGNR